MPLESLLEAGTHSVLPLSFLLDHLHEFSPGDRVTVFLVKLQGSKTPFAAVFEIVYLLFQSIKGKWQKLFGTRLLPEGSFSPPAFEAPIRDVQFPAKRGNR